eukprot:CAMPEP_0184518986 /NCGR_PEP_ID=MMETSP0198_2-20121128/6380_1 /TAXON_ID=1112570 /ORGANISM="Thraustochytrium sp., Strain LLF1b" /LENGTH=318 /DNA_ID=CAMNT_0026909461 /DNA_START=118 /DNA_END=1074 /DNA_ORIENTATION=+
MSESEAAAVEGAEGREETRDREAVPAAVENGGEDTATRADEDRGASEGHHARGEENGERRGGPPSNIDTMITVKVDNIPFTTTSDQVQDLFSAYGEIGDVYIPSRGGRPRGYAFVRFLTQESADAAIDQGNDKEIDGRQLRVQLAEKPRKRNPRHDGEPRGGGRGRPFDRRGGRDDGRYMSRDGGGYQPRDRGGYQPRDRGGYQPRDRGDYQPRDRGDYQPRDRGDYQPRDRDNGDYQPKDRGDYRPRDRGDRGDYKPRDRGDYQPRDRGDYQPRDRGDRGDYQPRDRGDRGDYHARDREDRGDRGDRGDRERSPARR